MSGLYWLVVLPTTARPYFIGDISVNSIPSQLFCTIQTDLDQQIKFQYRRLSSHAFCYRPDLYMSTLMKVNIHQGKTAVTASNIKHSVTCGTTFCCLPSSIKTSCVRCSSSVFGAEVGLCCMQSPCSRRRQHV